MHCFSYIIHILISVIIIQFEIFSNFFLVSCLINEIFRSMLVKFQILEDFLGITAG